MGIHSGMLLCETDPIMHCMDYFKPMINCLVWIQSSALGGKIMCNMETICEINARFLEVNKETEYSKQQSMQAVEAVWCSWCGYNACWWGQVKRHQTSRNPFHPVPFWSQGLTSTPSVPITSDSQVQLVCIISKNSASFAANWSTFNRMCLQAHFWMQSQYPVKPSQTQKLKTIQPSLDLSMVIPTSSFPL